MGSAIINVGLNFLLIPKLGGNGAAIATFFSYIALFVFHDIIVNRLGGLNISKKLYLYAIGITSIGFIVINLTYEFFVLRCLIIIVLGIYLIFKNRIMIKKLSEKFFRLK